MMISVEKKKYKKYTTNLILLYYRDNYVCTEISCMISINIQ